MIYETEYHKLCKRLGPYGSERTRREALKLWIDGGRPAAQWLIFRSCNETKSTILMEVAYVLAQIGTPALGPILDALESGCGHRHADMLISALRRISVDCTVESRIAQACKKYCEED